MPASRLEAGAILTVAEAAAWLGIPVSSCRHYVATGALPGRKLGRRTYFVKAELERAVMGDAAVPKVMEGDGHA